MTTYQEACGPTDTPDDIDIDVLREKYLYERDKRLRPEGSTQYLELKGEWADFYEIDPYTPVTFRDPISEDTDVVVLGGGIAGLLAGAYLKKAGVEGVRVIEMAGDFGGVWYWNRFPGIQCDNDAYCYIPFLEELNFIPSKKFATGPRSSSIAATSESISACTTARCSPPKCATCAGTSRSSGGGSARTAVTTSGLDSSS